MFRRMLQQSMHKFPEHSMVNDMHVGDTGISKSYVAKWDSVRIGNEQLKVAVIGLHFKAFPTDKASCAQREGQAAIARATIQDLSAAGVTSYPAALASLPA
jgi:hypothetical protein